MHIPDGYMSPATTLPVLGAMLPVWSIAVNRVKKAVGYRQLPLLSLCAAFSFVIMMFNVPLGESSVHAVGAVFAAILLGPWAACISVSIALVIQALVFGDGGIWAVGANCFNMAFVMPFVGYYTYRLIAGKSSINTRRSFIGIFIGSYAGLNAAAFLTAIMFGIQPLLFKTAGGVPLYGYYPLIVAIPVIMSEHLLIAGPIEGIVTVTAAAYLAKFSPGLFYSNGINEDNGMAKVSFFRKYKAFIFGLLILLVLTPLGLVATGTAWGEWGMDELKDKIGYIPQGMRSLADSWRALLPDYSVPGLQNGFLDSSLGYIVSAAAGLLAIGSLTLLTSRLLKSSEDSDQRSANGE